MPQLRWCYTHDAATILWWWCYDYEDKKNSSVRCHDGDPFAHEMTCWCSNYDDLTIWSCYNLLMMLKLWRCYNSSRKCYDTTPGDAMRTLLLPHERLCWWYNCPIYWSGDATTAPWDYLMMWQLKRCHNCVDATLMITIMRMRKIPPRDAMMVIHLPMRWHVDAPTTMMLQYDPVTIFWWWYIYDDATIMRMRKIPPWDAMMMLQLPQERLCRCCNIVVCRASMLLHRCYAVATCDAVWIRSHENCAWAIKMIVSAILSGSYLMLW